MQPEAYEATLGAVALAKLAHLDRARSDVDANEVPALRRHSDSVGRGPSLTARIHYRWTIASIVFLPAQLFFFAEDADAIGEAGTQRVEDRPLRLDPASEALLDAIDRQHGDVRAARELGLREHHLDADLADVVRPRPCGGRSAATRRRGERRALVLDGVMGRDRRRRRGLVHVASCHI